MRDRAVHVDVLGEPDRLAVVERLDLGELLGVRFHRLRQRVHQALAASGAASTPRGRP